jgi:hypothetical protein
MGILSVTFRFPNKLVKVAYVCTNLTLFSAGIYNMQKFEDPLFFLIWFGVLLGNWIVIAILHMIFKLLGVYD